jgi:flagellar hook-length control protein FliK
VEVAPAPVAEAAPVAPPATPVAAPVVPSEVVGAQQPAGDAAAPKGAETAGIEGNKTQAPAVATPVVEAATPEPEVASVVEELTQTSVAGRASVADSGSTRPGDRRSEGVSGGGAEARPSAQTPVTQTPTHASGQGGGEQGGSAPQDQRRETGRVTAQGAPPVTAPRVDVTPVAVNTPAPVTAAPRGAATLSQAPRAIGQLIHIASQNGVQHARLNLKPAELGGIEIRLQATAAGITAHLVADSPEAARLLQQAGDDLKRSLASQNVELLSLDVSTSGDDRRDASAAGSGFDQFDETGPRGGDGSGRSQRSGAGDDDSDLPTTQIAQGTVIELPDGVLVDVLA